MARSRARPAVSTTLRSALGEAKTSVASIAATASASATAVSSAGRGDVDVGHRGRDAEHRPVERERRERRDQPVVRGDLVRAAQRGDLGLHLAVPVHDALGRAGRAGGEDHRALGVRVGRGRQRAAAAEPGQLAERVGGARARAALERQRRSPAAIRRPGTRSAAAAASPRGMPITWSGPAPRSARPSPARPSPASATTTTAPIRQQA